MISAYRSTTANDTTTSRKWNKRKLFKAKAKVLQKHHWCCCVFAYTVLLCMLLFNTACANLYAF